MKNRDQENYRKWKRDWYAKHRKQEQERKKSYNKTEKGKIATKNSFTNQWNKSKHKILARKAVAKAVKSGKLKRMPCEVCGEKITDAHHPNYDKKLEVIWLCEPHHYERHRGPRVKTKGVYFW